LPNLAGFFVKRLWAVKPTIPADQPKLNWVEAPWLRETSFVRWLMGTGFWYRQVLKPSCAKLGELLAQSLPEDLVLLDAGCGEGLAFKLIEQHFKPRVIFALDIDADLISTAIRRGARLQTPTHVMQGDVRLASFQDNSFDVIFAHHLLSSSAHQTEVLEKLVALLKPGGFLLSTELCRAFTASWRVKLMSRRPAQAHKTAADYVHLYRQAGLTIEDNQINTARPWWSRRLLGLTQKLGIRPPFAATCVTLVARKPLDNL